MTFRTIHGSQESMPLEVEYCGQMCFVRKNIHKITETDPMTEETMEMWEYKEAYCTRAELAEYIATNANEANSDTEAKVYYVAMMTGVDL